MSSLKSRVLVSVVGVPLLLWVVLAAPVQVIIAALMILTGIAAFELMNCVGVGKTTFLMGWTIVSAALAVFTYYAQLIDVSAWLIIYGVGAFIYAIVKAGEVKFAQLMAGFFAVTAISYSFSAFLRMEAAGYHRSWLLLPFILSFACDTFAYIVGCSIGKHKLAPKVSPKKSVEGAIGGLVGNVLFGMLFLWAATRFGGGVTDDYSGYAIMALMGRAMCEQRIRDYIASL